MRGSGKRSHSPGKIPGAAHRAFPSGGPDIRNAPEHCWESTPGGGEAVYLKVFGCQMNKLDSQIALEACTRAGFNPVEDPAEARWVVFFTCSVRQHAEERFFSHVGKYRRRKEHRKDLRIAVCGCVAEEHGEALLERFPFVDVLCGTSYFHLLPQLLRDAERSSPVVALGKAGVSYARSRNLGQHPAQAYVAVMRGCSLRCAYCIVPRVRGPARSRPPEDIAREVTDLVKQGVVEVTLLGHTVNAYGRDLSPKRSLAYLLRLLSEISELKRIRFVTSHPRFMTDELIEVMAASPAVCESLHLPAQSGSDRILARMKRLYTCREYVHIVQKCYQRIPGLALAGDFIVGFPGETEEDFRKTVELVRRCSYQNLFVFKYSVRPGTPAESLPDDVPREVKERRNNELLALHRDLAQEANRRLIGSQCEVLVEGPSARNRVLFSGRTRTNHVVIFPPGDSHPGELRTVVIQDATAVALYGELVGEQCK